MIKLIQAIPYHWKKTIILVLAVFFLSVTIFFDSWYSIVQIWYRSGTFTHGFLILPISIWLIWSHRRNYITLNPKITWVVLIPVFISGFIWLLADLINVQVIKQFATVALLISGLCFVLGLYVAKKMLFPLFFLFLMVPVGEEAIPLLMEFTASFTVGLIRLTGMSVYREGLYFSLTSGNWSVVEACSGINYLIASASLGLVYAYFTYSKFWKRCLFVILSIIVPVFANGVRAYLIVMIGHFSGMKLAVGVDHLIYGGLFFGFVMMILFFFGSFWKDPMTYEVNAGCSVQQKEIANNPKSNWQQIVIICLVLSLCYVIWPLSSDRLSQQQQESIIIQNLAGLEKEGWKITEDPNWQWQADFKGVTNDAISYFTKDENIIAIYQASFGNETQGGGELVNSQNLIISSKDPDWKIVHTDNVEVITDNKSLLSLNETILRGENSDLIAIHWYHIGQYDTANKYLAKSFQLLNMVLAESAPEYLVVSLISTPKNRHKLARKKILAVVETWLKTTH